MESSSSFCSSPSYGTSLDHSDLEAGFCECTVKTHRPLCTRNKHRRAVAGSGMRRYESRFFCDAYNDSHDYGNGRHHFLDACFLCKKPLAGNCDIFMYRGDIPFCSEECRQVQMERDETKEKSSKYAVRAASRKPEQQQKPQNSQRIPVSAW